MFYFRENELSQLRQFYEGSGKACAIFGRRRVGKTELVLQSIKELDHSIYFQTSSFDYSEVLEDFKQTIKPIVSSKEILDSLNSFRTVFAYLNETLEQNSIIVIDEFPFLARKNEGIPAEFQWIIDHSLDRMKLVLLGSSTSFMKSQISDSSQPLYGRFDEILKILPYRFEELCRLFPDYADAMNVYAMTGGVAQYVMYFKEYESPSEAADHLFFSRNGRLFSEAGNLLMQEFRDISSYTSILRTLGSGEKEASAIAAKSGINSKIINIYLSKLEQLGIVSPVLNIFSSRRNRIRYRISDLFYRFHYSFIEPNVSMITQIGKKSRPYILDHAYEEYLGFVYEDITRNSLYQLALDDVLPFMPKQIGKWWGNIRKNDAWMESEIDIAASNGNNVLLGECKYRNRKAGLQELDNLRLKSEFAAPKGSKIIFLIASDGGFTKELLDYEQSDLILLAKGKPVRHH